MPAPYLLLVEDEPRMAAFLLAGLEEEGYRVRWVDRGLPALEAVGREPFDAVLLDVRLPDLDGVEVCRRLRLHHPALPILMLTALDAVEDRVRGLRSGADDYLPKPFAFEELLARVEALLRRARTAPAVSELTDEPLRLDLTARTCTVGGRPLDLTPREFDLLAYFLTRPGQVLSRDEIHRDVWGHDFDRGTNLIDVYVGYVRRKLQEAGCPDRLQTVRGLGYRYVPVSASLHDDTA